jgi:hypothetical protein
MRRPEARIRVLPGRFVAVARVMRVVVCVCLCCGAQRVKERRGPLQIQLKLSQERFLKKESMAVRVLIHNDGPSPLRIPNPANGLNSQPHYTISGPSYPARFTFSATNPHGVTPGTRPNEQESDLVVAAPGATVEGILPLEQMLQLERAGSYTIQATLDWAGTSVKSLPVRFTIEEPNLRSCALMVDDGFQLTFPIRAACLNNGQDQGRMYQAVFQEVRADLGELTLAKLLPVVPAGERIREVIGLWANFDRFALLMNKFVWVSDGVVGVQGGVAGEVTSRMPIPADFDRIVRPALVRESGQVDVLLLSASRGELELIRFPATGNPAVVWTASVASAPEAMRATLAPRGQGGAATAILLGRAGAQVQATLVESVQSGARARTASIGNVWLLPDSEPALRIDDGGTVHVSFVAARDSQLRSISVVDLAWTASSSVEQKISEPVQLDDAVRAAAVTYSATTRDPARREWVAVLKNGGVIGSRTRGNIRQVRGTVVMPLQVLAMSQMCYLLTTDTQTVLTLAAVQ